jgi:O-antigen/teichoic acid export membrane protein
VPVIAASIFKVMDKIMIGNFSTIKEVGYYENAEKMLNIILSVVSALGTVTLPQMTYLFNNHKVDEYNNILSKSCIFIMFIVLPIVAGFLVTSDDLVLLYLGINFKKSAILLKILSISLLFTPFASIIRMQILIPQEKDKEYIVSVIAGAIVNFILNILLIKKYQSIGASVATVISEAIVLFMEFYYSKKNLNLKKLLKNSFIFLISSIIMFVLIYIIGLNVENPFLRLILQILIGSSIYFTINVKYIKSIINFNKIFSNRKVG